MNRLCPGSGAVSSTVKLWLDFGLKAMLRVVTDPYRRDLGVRWSKSHESSLLLERNRRWGPLICSVFGVADGGRMRCMKCRDPYVQN